MENDIIRKASALAVRLAAEAGRMLLDSFEKEILIELKGEIDPVTDLDRKVEKFLVSSISREFPGHDFLAEEATETAGGSQFRWVIDPLDGTTNYARGFPCFTVSIALENMGDPVVGVIHQPATNEMFTASKGGGAFLNGRRLEVSRKATSLEHSFLVTGFPYDIRKPEVLERNLARFRIFLGRSFAVRRDGSAAWDLACVAAGRFDAFWEEGLKAWDTAAGALMVREAGGVITDFESVSFDPHKSGTILAAGPEELHREMLSLL
ncbi:MAG: inositol monophosphatase family protein [Gemmatimonadota bacterium]|nr:inositol monophosphatase family protein [Gemmatimonadota bacterium]